MPEVRVYLFTYRRPVLLARALRSLLAQTRRDWICELHNDDPDDDAPRQVLAEIAGNDPRFSYHRHERNLGAVASFNLAFQPVPELFAAILEDDNWWEPELLLALRGALDEHPDAVGAWSNMRVHEELADGSWRDTGRTIWPAGQGRRRFHWPVALQMFDALHSQGAFLFRAGQNPPAPVPDETPLAQIEPVRERVFLDAIVLDERPLANFSLTRATARSSNRVLWLQGQMLLTGSFLRRVPLSPAAWKLLWHRLQTGRPRNTSLFLLLALAGVARTPILAQAQAGDWMRLGVSFARRPYLHFSALAFRRRHSGLWEWLDRETARRTDEARRLDFSKLGADTLFEKTPGPA